LRAKRHMQIKAGNPCHIRIHCGHTASLTTAGETTFPGVAQLYSDNGLVTAGVRAERSGLLTLYH
jgi:hypothetical protein